MEIKSKNLKIKVHDFEKSRKISVEQKNLQMDQRRWESEADLKTPQSLN